MPSANLAYVVDPALRRRGYATEMVTALMAPGDLAHIELFAAGVEPVNLSSVGCLVAAGFAPLDPRSDWEGIVYFVEIRGRFGAPSGPATGNTAPADLLSGASLVGHPRTESPRRPRDTRQRADDQARR